ncbi:anti-sigma factor [Piscinibacter sakaiensis]|uniref:anti-sigma factor n=1 Tax=Piscinibacter sakaiensis TaxID=1547922 RepID=UPI003AACCA14
MDYSRPDLADRLAADYVSGTLRGAARRRLERLLPAHPALREAVHAWQDRLAPLTASIEPRDPPPAVWHGIESRLGFSTERAAPARRSGWWQRLAFWRGMTAFASVAALSAMLLLAQPGSVEPPIIVVLNATGAPAADGAVVPASFVASISGDGRAVVTRPLTDVALQADRALELWAVPPEGAPRSLGLINAKAATVVRRERLLDGTAALAVSLEPPGGSPTGAPTGPVLYVGKLGT